MHSTISSALSVPVSVVNNPEEHLRHVPKNQKKGKSAKVVDDPFDDSADSGDLFPSPANPTPAAVSPTKPKPSVSAGTVKAKSSPSTVTESKPPAGRRKLDPEARVAKFDELYTFVSTHTGRRPEAKDPLQVRNSVWKHLFGLAKERGQLERVAGLFSKWKEGGRVFKEDTVEAFVRRCEELKCADLALGVFSDRPKYGLDLASPKAARRLLHSLHAEHPLSSSITLAALYRLYGLPALATDPVACALLTSACLRVAKPIPTNSNTEIDTKGTERKSARTVANALVPALKDVLESTKPMPIKGQKGLGKDGEVTRERVWMKWCLRKIEKALVGKGEDAEWVHKWRIRSGYILPGAPVGA
ncbi:hypothetical protein EW146_g315 [Bondarzewia mesenterica]|uniref:Uncharacterized protein n=1 Tax=Bondarzewia mesenterica TaxID=1095465 RepID=A0A4S4M9Q3_9AGAM|nr:hypothetical protein EW146_g315 [Bondarzewia mesenterica]